MGERRLNIDGHSFSVEAGPSRSSLQAYMLDKHLLTSSAHLLARAPPRSSGRKRESGHKFTRRQRTTENSLRTNQNPSSSILETSSSVERHTTRCAVCLVNLVPASSICQLGCKHTFHSECIARWVASHPWCPLCRASLH